MNESFDEKYKLMWDNRYKEQGYAYGKCSNIFFREWLQKFEPGTILMPGDGEGRNGVFAATRGFDVHSFDLSAEGKNKALELARENDVTIKYTVGDLEHLDFAFESFDGIGLIFAHFAAEKKSSFHKRLNNYLKPGGIIIFEAFSKKHLPFRILDPKIGGPEDINMLYSINEITADFPNYDLLLLTEKVVYLGEGKYHKGQGSVIRFVGRKRY